LCYNRYMSQDPWKEARKSYRARTNTRGHRKVTPSSMRSLLGSATKAVIMTGIAGVSIGLLIKAGDVIIDQFDRSMDRQEQFEQNRLSDFKKLQEENSPKGRDIGEPYNPRKESADAYKKWKERQKKLEGDSPII